MAIPKTFTAGERLFAADLNDNFVASDAQGVRVFADAAARTTGIPTPAEGMLTFNKDTGQLEVFDGAAFVVAAPEPPAGIGSNVVSTVKTNVFSTTSESFVEVPGLNVSITPTSATSKVLVIANVQWGTNNNDGDASGIGSTVVKMTRGGTDIYIGDTSGGAIRALWGGSTNFVSLATMLWSGTVVFLDSPATTSSTNYRIETRRSTTTGSANINQGRSGVVRGASSITAIEVAV